MKNLKEEARPKSWRPCEYFHRLNTALAASHSVLNYSMFLALATLPKAESLVKYMLGREFTNTMLGLHAQIKTLKEICDFGER
jgi:hypothetical protein